MLIWPFAKVNGREKSFFGLPAKVYVRVMPIFCNFCNLRNILVAKVSDLNVNQECFKLQFQDHGILCFKSFSFKFKSFFGSYPELRVLAFSESILHYTFLGNKPNI